MQSPFYKQNKIVKVDISLKQLLDVDTTNELAYRRVDNIFPNQVLTSYTNTLRRDAFRFKYLTDLIQAGTGVTITNNAGIITIASTGTASPLTTKGDLYTYTTTNARLPVGTNGQILYADSTTATGLKWDAAPSGGGGSGIPYGVASGTNTYAVTISGVTAYTAGNAYIISFTNGNDDDSTININGLGAKLLVKEFDVQVTGGDIVSGQDLIIIYDGTNFQTLGVAPNQLFAYVTNDDSVTITKGQPVYAFSAAGNRMSVKLANNTSDATSAQTVGVVFSTSIAPNQTGFIITQGVISGINTAAYSPGNQLYLGATAGSLTATKPYAPNHLVYIGIVERANAGNGQIYVKPQNGYELDEIHDVVATSPANNDYMYYDSSTSLYRLRQFTAAQITDSTTVGQNIVKLPDPSAVSYLRINADNSVSALTLAQLKADIGVGGYAILTSDFTTSGTAYQDVPGLSFAVSAGKTYKWRATILIVATGTTNGMLSTNGPTGTTTYRFTIGTGGTTVTVNNGSLNNTGTAVAMSTTRRIASSDGIYEATASGTVYISIISSVSAALTLKAGSIIEYEEVI